MIRSFYIVSAFTKLFELNLFDYYKYPSFMIDDGIFALFLFDHRIN